MTVTEAIEALTRLHDEGHGDAPLLTADGLPVVKFDLDADADAVYISGRPQPGAEG
jgi:hypothetical protein